MSTLRGWEAVAVCQCRLRDNASGTLFNSLKGIYHLLLTRQFRVLRQYFSNSNEGGFLSCFCFICSFNTWPRWACNGSAECVLFDLQLYIPGRAAVSDKTQWCQWQHSSVQNTHLHKGTFPRTLGITSYFTSKSFDRHTHLKHWFTVFILIEHVK